jgi:hypothetical protein
VSLGAGDVVHLRTDILAGLRILARSPKSYDQDDRPFLKFCAFARAIEPARRRTHSPQLKLPATQQ